MTQVTLSFNQYLTLLTCLVELQDMVQGLVVHPDIPEKVRERCLTLLGKAEAQTREVMDCPKEYTNP